MNKSVIHATPPGDFEEVSIHMPEWEKQFRDLVERGKRIKYRLPTMPIIPEGTEQELSNRTYLDCILEQDRWQHFLIPPPC